MHSCIKQKICLFQSSSSTGKRYSANGDQKFYLFKFDIETSQYRVLEVLGEYLRNEQGNLICDCRKSTLKLLIYSNQRINLSFRCTKDGKLYLWNKELLFEPDRPNGLIFFGELQFDEVRKIFALV